MNVREINQALWQGETGLPGILPHLDQLAHAPFVYQMEFGLGELPREPGLIQIRGARQYGKSTWLESQIKITIEEYGPGSALYLNGDELQDASDLMERVRELMPLFSSSAAVRRLFIDEVTAVREWQRGLKRLIDAGELRDVLVVTTGSRAADLRHGSERLPGRKGRLERTAYLFTPVSYSAFREACGSRLGQDGLVAYLLSGGSPVALNELATTGRLPQYVLEMVRDWVVGEFAASGRQRGALLAVMECLLRHGGSPLGQARLAREAGLANNTVAAGYLELLMDLMCIATARAWDEVHRVTLARRPAKFPVTNLLAAVAWHPSHPRSPAEFRALPADEQGKWLEWLVAQELWRNAAIRGDDSPEAMAYWQSKTHEIDFVLSADWLLEVKRRRVTPLEFAWFRGCFPRSRLTVIAANAFETERIRAMSLEQFLLKGLEPG
ncbi:MAG: ATP-binding protein [Armatimonadetes bacterium]|nr:ATP-binding protein [Armatimonadota bacterium]